MSEYSDERAHESCWDERRKLEERIAELEAENESLRNENWNLLPESEKDARIKDAGRS